MQRTPKERTTMAKRDLEIDVDVVGATGAPVE